jgi:hypothetical protein
MFDLTTLFWTGIGVTALTFAFLDYALSYKKRMKAETQPEI